MDKEHSKVTIASDEAKEEETIQYLTFLQAQRPLLSTSTSMETLKNFL